MRFDIITIFPNIFNSYFSQTILARAQKKGLIDICIHDLRKHAKKGNLHRSVDDRPYGGGPGMIMMVEPIFKALRALKGIRSEELGISGKKRIILLTPTGNRFTQRDAERLVKYKQLILICGRYEGFDARVEKFADEKISLGDFVLAGGEIPAMAIVEAVSRHIPGVIGHPKALKEETFSKDLEYKEYPQYTRPEVFFPVSKKQKNKKAKKQTEGWRVPKVLLSGNHKKIEEWRRKKVS